MKKKKLGYLGFLGLSGFLGLVTGNLWLLSFFGFFGFFGMLRGDERIDRNIDRACRNAFAFYVIITTLSMIYIISSRDFGAMPLFVALLSQGVTIFGLSYTYYNGREG